MSIFDHSSGLSSVPWMQEKLLLALQESARIVDLANEADTNSWYKKKLTAIASSLIGRLAPLVALSHQSGEESAQVEEWQSIITHGSLALAKWCKRWGVVNPNQIMSMAIPTLKDEEEFKEKQTVVEKSGEDDDDDGLKMLVYSHMSLAMLNKELPDVSKRILSWLLANLRMSDYADSVDISTRFLPGDIGCTPEETREGYKYLYEKGIIEQVEKHDSKNERVLVRLVVGGENGSKYPLCYEEIPFGFPGARINGQQTIGNTYFIDLGRQGKILEWQENKNHWIVRLKEYLIQNTDRDVLYLEEISLDKYKNNHTLQVKARILLTADDSEINIMLNKLVVDWLKTSTIATKEE